MLKNENKICFDCEELQDPYFHYFSEEISEKFVTSRANSQDCSKGIHYVWKDQLLHVINLKRRERLS